MSLGALAIDSLKDSAEAILVNHYTPDGIAAAEVIFGDTNPSGKLPYTMYPKNYTTTTEFLNMSMVAGEGRTYRYYQGEPLWPFGFGLSFTSFALEIGKEMHSSDDKGWTVVVRVTNTGHFPGAEVLQVFARGPVSSMRASQAPSKWLVDYKKVALAPGGTEEVTFTIQPSQLSTVDSDGRRQILAGQYVLDFTNGVQDPLEVPIKVEAAQILI